MRYRPSLSLYLLLLTFIPLSSCAFIRRRRGTDYLDKLVSTLDDLKDNGEGLRPNEVHGLQKLANLSQTALNSAVNELNMYQNGQDKYETNNKNDEWSKWNNNNWSDWKTKSYWNGTPPPTAAPPPPTAPPPLPPPLPHMVSNDAKMVTRSDKYTDKLEDKIGHMKDKNNALKVGLGIGISIPVGLFLCSLFIFCCWKRRRALRRLQEASSCDSSSGFTYPIKKGNTYDKHRDINSPEMTSDDAWELDRTRLVIDYDNKLGSGAFCNVFKGHIIGESPVLKMNSRHLNLCADKLKDCDVAVKMLPSFADDMARSDFMQEINFMKSLAYHPHLVSMLGYVADRKSPYLLVHYCEKGDLLHYVREKREEILTGYENLDSMKIKDILSFAWQISDGLEYLTSVGCIHRDIAARNVLVDGTNTARIGDFGLCRLTDTLLYTTRGGRLPLKWLAPESLASFEYSFKTDVWSYGVLLWEIFALGEVPYGQIQNTELLDFLRSGRRLERPDICPQDMYDLMQMCWADDSGNRPTFSIISQKLGKMLEEATESYGYLIPIQRESVLLPENVNQINIDDV